MESYEPPSHGLIIQTVRDSLSELTWTTCVAVLAFSCLATRLITGLQSRQRDEDPSEPRTAQLAPYWFPWLGHGFSFLWNHVSLFEALRDSMREPTFRVYLRGETHDTVVSPSMMKNILSSPVTSNTPVLDQALQNVFGDRSLVRNLGLTRNHEVNDDVSGMMDRDSFIAEASATISRLVQRNTPSLVTFCRSPVDQTPWERESQASLLEHDQTTCEVNLFTLVKSFVGHNLTTFLLGEAFVEAFPGLLDDLWTLDSNFVMLFIGTPRWVPSPGVSAGHAARDRLLHVMSIFYRAFTAWDDGIDPGIELRELDDVSDLFKERMRTFRQLELSPKASAAGHLSLYWDIVEHVTKMTYWTIVHIFADNALLKDIREELLSSVKPSRLSRQETGFPIDEPPRVDLDLEKVLETGSLLKACYYESIRLHSASISFRKLEADLTITESTKDAAEPRTYKIRKGEKVIMPHGVYQNDPDRFSNPDQYDPLRFILTNAQSGTKQANAESLAPLAHGIYGPKSNSVTERATLGLVAAIVSMWDISATGEGSLSVPSHSDKMSWGAFQPAKEMRVKLKSTV